MASLTTAGVLQGPPECWTCANVHGAGNNPNDSGSRSVRRSVDERGPPVWLVWVTVAKRTRCFAQRLGGGMRLEAGDPILHGHDVAVQSLHHVGRVIVPDGPERGDDVLAAGDEQRTAEGDRFIGDGRRALVGRAGREEGEPSFGQALLGEVPDRQPAIVELEPTGRRCAIVREAVEREVEPCVRPESCKYGIAGGGRASEVSRLREEPEQVISFGLRARQRTSSRCGGPRHSQWALGGLLRVATVLVGRS